MVSLLVLAALCVVACALSAADVQASLSAPVQTFFSQPLSHSDALVSGRLQQRVVLDGRAWLPQRCGPLLVLAGPETPLDAAAFARLAVAPYYAPQLNGFAVGVEHRFYGASQPENANATLLFGHLNVQQAAADVNAVVCALLPLLSLLCPSAAPTPSVVAFGGSYGGLLAVALRATFPATFAAAVATGAPLLLNYPALYGGYARLTADVFWSMPQQCGAVLQKGFHLLAQNPRDQRVAQLFNLCAPVQEGQEEAFLLFAMVPFFFLSQFNYNSTKLIYPNALQANVSCAAMANLTADPVAAVARGFLDGLSFSSLPSAASCFQIPPYAPAIFVGGLSPQYNWQRCTQIVMPLASDESNSIFPPVAFSQKNYAASCDPRISPQFSFVNDTLGGRNVAALSNIIFANGRYDPVASQSVQQSRGTIEALWAEMGHGEDLFAPEPWQHPSVMDLRRTVVQKLQTWISQQQG